MKLIIPPLLTLIISKQSADLTISDSQELFELIQNHYHATESTKALMILENWDSQLKHFIKVIPTDYKKALERLAEESTEKQTV